MASMACDHHQAKGRPVGYRFHPTNRELLKYLLGFARDEPLPDQYQLMQLVDLYADKEPWQIFESANVNNNNNNTRYFITPHKKTKPSWKRVSRTVGKGTWKPQGKGKEVFDDKGRLMGYVKSLKYIPANKSSNRYANGEWLMTEYSLYDGYVDAGKIKNKGFVICKIKKKEKASDDKNKGVNNENMKDVEEFINSILEEKEEENNNVEYLEEDEVGEHVLAMLGCDDDVSVEHYKDVEEYMMNSEENNNGIANKDEENNIEYLEGEQVGEHILAALEDIDLDDINFL